MFNPIENYWSEISQKLSHDLDLYKNNPLYRSPYEPDITITGYFVNGKLRINLSELFSFLIQNTGQYCQHYQSDLLYNIKSLNTIIENNSPQDAVTYACIGIRTNGVDGLGYFISRMQDTPPDQLATYYHQLYFLRIIRKNTNHETYANSVLVQLNELQPYEIVHITKLSQQHNFTFNDFCNTNIHTKTQETFDKLSLAEQQFHEYYQTMKEINENLSTIQKAITQKPAIPQQYFQTQELQNVAEHIRANQIEELNKYLKQLKDC